MEVQTTRKIKMIIVHCAATPLGMDVGAKEIRAWHLKDHPDWADIGYHYVIRLDGTIEKGRPEYRQGAHCYGYNKHSIGVCYVGGLDKDKKPCDTRTEAQKKALKQLLSSLVAKYGCMIYGHNEFSAKACPCFDARKEYAELCRQVIPSP